MPGWQFVECRPDMLDQVLAIEDASFAHPWKCAQFLSELTCPDSLKRAVIAPQKDSGQTLIAYSFSRIIIDELHIFKIAVAQAYRRRGIATALLEHGFELARQQGCRSALLEVRESNPIARRLYEKVGFQQIGTRPGYYSDTGETALIYRQILEED